MPESTAHDHLDELKRDDLTAMPAAVSRVLDDWLMRTTGVTSSHHEAGLFLDLLADEGYAVVEAGSSSHIVDFGPDGWTIQHPLACRPNLFDCPVNKAAGQQLAGPPESGLGRYEINLDGDLRLELTRLKLHRADD